MKPLSFTSKKSSQGFSLIEVLISILIMTFGLLGISGLMLKGIDNATGSDLSARASQSANEIMDAMRANADNKSAYLTGMGKKASEVTGSTIADQDVKQWLTSLALLPGGQGAIETDASITNGVKVTIQFNNCVGTLTKAELDNCKSTSSNKRVLLFKFSV
jgi:type IV pilus assembly protein PilV